MNYELLNSEKKKLRHISNCKADFCWEFITFIYLVPLVCGALRDCSSVLPCQQALVMCQPLSAYCRSFGNLIPNGNHFVLIKFLIKLCTNIGNQSTISITISCMNHEMNTWFVCARRDWFDITAVRLLQNVTVKCFVSDSRCVFVQNWFWCDSWFNMTFFVLCTLCTLVDCVFIFLSYGTLYVQFAQCDQKVASSSARCCENYCQ